MGSEGEAKLPFFVPPAAPGEPPITALAGVWEAWRGPEGEEIEAVAVVTCEAGPDIAHIHHREPVSIRGAEDAALWLGEAGKGAARLMTAAPAARIARHPVDRRVNSNRAEGPDLIEPVAR